MGLAAVLPYFDSILEGLEFTKWEEPFAADNIPSSIIDRAYHLTAGPIDGIQNNQANQDAEMGVQVRIFLKGFAYPSDARDEGIFNGERVVIQAVKPENRTLTAGLLNVVFNSMALEPLADSNDNMIVIVLDFTARVILPCE